MKTGIKTKGMSGKPIVTEAPYGYVCLLYTSRIFSDSPHIVFVAHLENHFIKRLFLLSITDFLVVVFDAAVFALSLIHI